MLFFSEKKLIPQNIPNFISDENIFVYTNDKIPAITL